MLVSVYHEAFRQATRRADGLRQNKPESLSSALLAMHAVAIAILLSCPMRVKNLASLDLDRHIIPNATAPTLEDGDLVLVDMNQKSPLPPRIFVLHDSMGLVTNRLEHIPSSDPPAARVISDNSLYSAYERTADEVNIIGRIRWFARQV